MAYIDELRAKKAKYMEVKGQVSSSIAQISTLNKEINKIIESSPKAYLIDDMGADQNHVNNQKDTINSALSTAQGVLSAIDSRISQLAAAIAAEEARLAAEAARREAEAAAAAAQKNKD